MGPPRGPIELERCWLGHAMIGEVLKVWQSSSSFVSGRTR